MENSSYMSLVIAIGTGTKDIRRQKKSAFPAKGKHKLRSTAINAVIMWAIHIS